MKIKMTQGLHSATTRWIDSECDDLDKALSKIIEPIADDDSKSNISWKNWQIKRCFDTNQEIKLNGRMVRYNLLDCQYDQVTNGTGLEEELTTHKNFFVIVYHLRKSVCYIINQNSPAKKILRKLLKYTGKNEITENNFEFPSDFFVWLINKIYNADTLIDSSELELESIKSFRGNTEDSQNKVSAEGESVMNILSTLSFLLESRQLDQLTIEIRYSEHENINLVLRSGTVKIDFSPYQGIYEGDSRDSKLVKLYLLVYLEILPILDQAYKSDKDDDIWNDAALQEFSKNIADTIQTRINNRLAELIKTDSEE